MKRLVFLWLLAVNVPMVQAREVTIEVYGMTCAFCVDSLQRKFSAMPEVRSVQVSLQNKQVSLQTEETAPSLETLRQAVTDAGFTPEKITVSPAAQKTLTQKSSQGKE